MDQRIVGGCVEMRPDPSSPAGRHIDVRVFIPQRQVTVVKVPQSRNPIDRCSRVKRDVAHVLRKRIQAPCSEQCEVWAEENEIKRITENYSHKYSSSEPPFGGRTVWRSAHSTFRMLSGSPILQDGLRHLKDLEIE